MKSLQKKACAGDMMVVTAFKRSIESTGLQACLAKWEKVGFLQLPRICSEHPDSLLVQAGRDRALLHSIIYLRCGHAYCLICQDASEPHLQVDANNLAAGALSSNLKPSSWRASKVQNVAVCKK